MTRVAVALVVVIGLAAGVWWLWPAADPQAQTTTLPVAAPTSAAAPPPNTPGSTSTTVADSHLVETVEEAEEILRHLWFGWFEGIYLQDEDRIREVVVMEEQVETARSQFGTADFARAPTIDDIRLAGTEILRSDSACLVVWSELILDGFRVGASTGVDVLRWMDDRWKRRSLWQYRTDLWEADCESF